MIKISLFFLYIFFSTFVHSKPLDINFIGAITEPTCEILANSLNQCESISKNKESNNFIDLEKKNISIQEISNFISSYQSSKIQLELTPTITNKNSVNLFITYK